MAGDLKEVPGPWKALKGLGSVGTPLRRVIEHGGARPQVGECRRK